MSAATTLPYRPTAEGLSLTLRVQPGAGRDAIAGLVATAEGGAALKVKVAAPAEDGRANAAVLALVARACGLPRRAVTLLQGERDRRKVLALAGDPAELARRLAPLLRAASSDREVGASAITAACGPTSDGGAGKIARRDTNIESARRSKT